MISALRHFWRQLFGNSEEEVIESLNEIVNENNKRINSDFDNQEPQHKRQKRTSNDIDTTFENLNTTFCSLGSSSSCNHLSNGIESFGMQSSFSQETVKDKPSPLPGQYAPLTTSRFQRLKMAMHKNEYVKENLPSTKYLPRSHFKHPNKASALMDITKMREKMAYNTLIRSQTPITSNILNEFNRSKLIKPAVIVDLTNDTNHRDTCKSQFDLSKSKRSDTASEPIDDLQIDFSNISFRKNLKPLTTKQSEWIHNLNKRFNQKEVQRKLKIEDEKFRAKVLHEKNKIFDKVLNDRLLQQLHVKEVIDLVEEEKPKEEETVLPIFSDAEENRISKAMRSPAHQQLIQKFGYVITGACIYSLSGLNWLNDNVINFYMKLLTQRGEMSSKLKVHAMDSFFCVNLKTRGYSSVRRWTRKVDIFSYDLMPIPVHVNGVHWCMLIIDFRNKTLNYYDSMGGSNKSALDMVEQYLKDESLDKKKVKFDFSGWKKECVKDIPQQMNGCDCGVFSCMFAEYICRGARISFTQQQMPYFRKKMCLEILEGRLLT